MDSLLLHPLSRTQLGKFAISGNHALMITGATGSGVKTIAEKLVSELLHTPSLDNLSYYKYVDPMGKHISIEQIREVQSFLMLRTTGTQTIRRVVLIHNADTMTDEAQNALLKSLEEPPVDTVMILTSTRPQIIKQTIHSRLHTVVIRRILLDDAITYFNTNYDIKQITWAHAISDGQVGLMKALLENKQDHPIASQIVIAKQLYGMSQYERLIQVEPLSKDKDKIPDLLYACKRICIGALESASVKTQDKSVQTWYKQLALITNAEEQMRYNPNPKLFLTNLFFQM